jgi:hypothetical protein
MVSRTLVTCRLNETSFLGKMNEYRLRVKVRKSLSRPGQAMMFPRFSGSHISRQSGI